MRKALILACAFATIATPALAVDQAKVAVLERKCVPTNRPPYRLPTRRKLLQKLVLQTKDRHEAFQLLDKVIEQTDIASEADSAWFDQCLALYGSAKCKVGAHSVAWDALTRAANANYQAQKYAESLPLD